MYVMKKEKQRWLMVLLIIIGMANSAAALDLTAITVFACNDKGVVNPAMRWD